MTLVLNFPPQVSQPEMPLVGDWLGLKLGLDIKRDPLGYFLDLRERYGDLVTLRLKPKSVIVISRPELIGPILTERHFAFQKSSYTQLLKPVVGRGLILAEGQKWKEQRQTAAAGFNGPALASYCAAVDDEARRLAQRWRQLAKEGRIVNASRDLSQLTLQIILRTLFGQNTGEHWYDIYLSLTSALRTIEKRVWSLAPISAHLPTRENFRFAREIRNLRQRIAEILERAAADKRAGNRSGDRPPSGRLADHLLDAYGPDSDRPDIELLADEALIYILAGIDTTANAVCWTLHLLNEHSEVAKSVREEVDAACRDDDELTMARMDAFPLTRSVLCEAMRLYPPVWTFSRIAIEDVELPGLSLRKGQNIMISPWVLHRDRRLWPDPERFDPSRFASGLPARGRGYTFLPFGYGPRGCLGARFAMIEAVIVLARLFRALRLGPVPGRAVRPEPMITLRPSPDLLLAAEARA